MTSLGVSLLLLIRCWGTYQTCACRWMPSKPSLLPQQMPSWPLRPHCSESHLTLFSLLDS